MNLFRLIEQAKKQGRQAAAAKQKTQEEGPSCKAQEEVVDD
jgi:hypothetical protein